MTRVPSRRSFIGLTAAALSLLGCHDNAERVSYAPQLAASGNAAPAQSEAPATRPATAIVATPASTRFEPGQTSDPRADLDGDGIPSARDQCPADAEDLDGFEDSDGCPDPDNDQDGVRDVNDLCPNDAEDRDGVQDDDGCPERA